MFNLQRVSSHLKIKIKARIISFLFVSLSLTASAQFNPLASSIKRADLKYDQFAYSRAVDYYKYAYQKDSLNERLVSQIGMCYVKLNNSTEAEVWLKILLKKWPGTDSQYKYLLAQQLSKNKKYDEATYWYGVSDRDDMAKEKIRGIESLGKLLRDSSKYEVSAFEHNSPQSDFSPMYFEKGIAFLSSRKEEKWVKETYNWDESNYLDFYSFDPYDTTMPIKKLAIVNPSYHEGPGEVFASGNGIVFTRNGLQEANLRRGGKRVARLQIYFSYRDASGKWLNPIPFKYNDNNYSLGHPTISSDEKTLIFSSDMPGGFGATDLYISKMLPDSTWSKPENLGSKINTAGNEMFPYLEKNQLYFASDGHMGLGGLDLYVADLVALDTQTPSNLGAPLNSSKDDFGLIADAGFRAGYFSSDRNGNDDIFRFSTNYTKVVGCVLTLVDSMPISGAMVNRFGNNGELVETLLSNSKGEFFFEIPNNSRLKLTAEKSSYYLHEGIVEHVSGQSLETKLPPIFLFQPIVGLDVVDIATMSKIEGAIQTIRKLPDTEPTKPISDVGMQFVALPGARYEILTSVEGYYTKRDTVEVPPTTIPFVSHITKLSKILVGESIRLDHIFYDSNSASLRPESEAELDKVSIFMSDNPHLKIELGSHTDSRGSASYNLSLSQKRAESAAKFLILQGVAANRIVPKGYGESKVLNGCGDGVACSADEHQENRRTEIKILEVN
ncbi:MAG: OmpA family protein [Imperialibacter sp.]|uniref:OmpA family protein n=1 Tax=Imperialibacter sp. TaxID=2038411 RepID=UPI0032ED0E24